MLQRLIWKCYFPHITDYLLKNIITNVIHWKGRFNSRNEHILQYDNIMNEIIQLANLYSF